MTIREEFLKNGFIVHREFLKKSELEEYLTTKEGLETEYNQLKAESGGVHNMISIKKLEDQIGKLSDEITNNSI